MKKLALVMFSLSIMSTFNLDAVSNTLVLDGEQIPPLVVQKCAGAKNFFVCVRNEMLLN